MILTIRTDKPESELGVFDADGTQIEYITWEAHRKLAETLHSKIDELLANYSLTGIVFYEGPGSFTGLRIGVSVANALAYSYAVPIIAATGEQWISEGLRRITSGATGYAVPNYGGEVFTTKPKK